MRISFKCRTNKDYVMINTAKFTLPTGTTLTVDRTSTEYDIEGEILDMTWGCTYLHAIDGNCIFSDTAYITDSSGFEDLVADAKVIFELEDDADEDYEVEILEVRIGE